MTTEDEAIKKAEADSRKRSRRDIVKLGAAIAAGAVAGSMLSGDSVSADHAEGGTGNFESDNSNPAIHAQNTNNEPDSPAIVADSAGGAAILASAAGGVPAIIGRWTVILHPVTPASLAALTAAPASTGRARLWVYWERRSRSEAKSQL